MSGHQPTSLPFVRARKPDASRASSETNARATKPTAKSEEISSRSARATPSTSEVRASSAAIRRRLSSSRSRSGELAGCGDAWDDLERPRGRSRGRAPGLPRPRQRSPTRARGRSGRGEATRLWSSGRGECTEQMPPRSKCFRLQTAIPARSKDGSTGPLWLSTARNSVAGTGRCEPRRAPGLAFRGEQLEKARRTDPPERRAFSDLAVHAVFIQHGLSWPAVW